MGISNADHANRRRDFELISQIADRARQRVYPMYKIDDDKLTVVMDLEHAHMSCPMDLQKFLDFSPGNFAHDMLGIRRHINRQTGELEGCFVPRCALPEPIEPERAGPAEHDCRGW